MGIPLPIIIMIAMMMLMFAIAVIVLVKKKGDLFKQTVDAKPEKNITNTKGSQQ